MKTLQIFCIPGRKRGVCVCACLGILLAAALVLSICVGAVSISPTALFHVLAGERESMEARIILFSRLPRTFGSLLAGVALAVAGVLIQVVLANPLAAPNIIGVNSGAGLAVVICCALAPGAAVIVPVAAFAGALAGVLVVLVFAERTGASRMTLVLAGVAISGIFNAAIDAIVTIVPDALLGYSDFRIGGLAGVTLARLWPAFFIIVIGIGLAGSLYRQLEVLALGPEMAQSLGLSVRPMRILFLVIAAALAGAAVSFAGLIGFVGLVVPHAMRRLVGEECGWLLLSSALGGALLLLCCDLAARTIVAPYELPVGIVLSLVGGPFFLWLLFRQRGRRKKKGGSVR